MLTPAAIPGSLYMQSEELSKGACIDTSEEGGCAEKS